jgi:hypothetical protein
MAKSGVGKMTTAVNLAHGLAMRGKRVLLAGGIKLVELKNWLGEQPRDIRQTVLANALVPREGALDYLIFDCPPGWDVGVRRFTLRLCAGSLRAVRAPLPAGLFVQTTSLLPVLKPETRGEVRRLALRQTSSRPCRTGTWCSAYQRSWGGFPVRPQAAVLAKPLRVGGDQRISAARVGCSRAASSTCWWPTACFTPAESSRWRRRRTESRSPSCSGTRSSGCSLARPKIKPGRITLMAYWRRGSAHGVGCSARSPYMASCSNSHPTKD